MTQEEEKFLKRYLATPIEAIDWLKHVAITNNRVYRLDTMTDITDQKYIHIDGYSYNVRKIAFYLIHGRWPARGFLLPWE